MSYVHFKNPTFIVDENYIIKKYNEEAKKLMNNIKKGEKCYKAIYGYDSPCLDCPLFTKNPDGNVMHKLISDKELFATYTNLPSTNGKSEYVVTIYDREINDLIRTKEIDLMKKKMDIYRYANYTLAYAYFDVNLTKNLLISDIVEVVDNVEQKVDLKKRGFTLPIDFAEFNKWRVERGKIVGKEEYLDKFLAENMIEKFKNGETTVEMLFQSKSTSGYDTWQQQTYYMYKLDYDDEIYALGILRDVAAQKTHEQQIKRNEDILNVLANDYSSVFYLDFNTGLVSIVRLPEDIDLVLKKDLQTSDYKTLWNLYLEKRVRNSDASKILGVGDIDFLKTSLSENKTYSYIYRVGDEYTYKYYEMKIAGLCDGNKLKAAVIGVADRDKAIKEQQEQQRILENALQLAKKDSLTGIYNRTAYDFAEKDLDIDVINGEIKEYAILMCDINNLKKTNDEFGHEKGNMLVINASRLISDVFKNSPVYRIGGDEFVVILTGVDFQNRFNLYEQFVSIIKNNENKKAPIYDRVSLASGIAEYDKKIDKSANDVFQRADVLMYKNKAIMKNIEK